MSKGDDKALNLPEKSGNSNLVLYDLFPERQLQLAP